MQENKTSRMFLLVAVGLGILATIAAFIFINGAAERGPKIRLLVAAHDLRPGVAIDPERDFKELEVPEGFSSLRNLTVSAREMTAYKGQKLNRRIQADQPVLLRDFAAGGDIEWKGPNERVLTINAVPGIAIPGDYVKLMGATGQMLAGGQQFRILAIGGLMQMIRQPVTMGEAASSTTSGPRPVTLEVTEAQASDLLKGMGPNQERVNLLICPPPPTTAESRPAN